MHLTSSTEHLVVKKLKTRALALEKTRAFFKARGVLEVDTPLLSSFAPIDRYIDVMQVETGCSSPFYLHTSPEYAMKKLLAMAPIDLYQLSHVFRAGEKGEKHALEFTMIEWYRKNCSLQFLIQETIELFAEFIDVSCMQTYTYEEAFLSYCGFNPLTIPLLKLQKKTGINSPHLNEHLDYLWATQVEEKFPENTLILIHPFPEFLSALAQVKNGKAQRFELYYNGLELANGYDELFDAKQLRTRLEEANRFRVQEGKPSLPIDEFFLDSVEKINTPYVGVAVGFDRLLMAQEKAERISEVLSIDTHQDPS